MSNLAQALIRLTTRKSLWERVLARVVIEAGRKDTYLQMFSKTSETFQKDAVDLVKWAMDVLEKDDRIKWFIKRVRLADEEFRKADRKAKQAWSEERKDGMAKQRDPIEWLKEKLAHYIENAKANKYGLVLNYTFKPDEKSADLLNELQRLEDDSFSKKGKNARYIPSPDKTFLKLNDTWEWQVIEQKYCLREGRAMNHCGNKAAAKEGDNVLSLREKVEVDGKEVWQPHATFILNDGVLGEMKGFGNEKPDEKLHPYILELLEDERITRVKGGGHAARQNFKLKDLSEQNMERLEKSRQDLIQSQGTPLEELAERIDQAFEWEEENHKSEENWGEYLTPDYTSLTLDHLEGDAQELVEELQELAPDSWEDELWELGKTELGDHFYGTNEIARWNIGTGESKFSEDLKDEIDNLNDKEKENLKGLLSNDTYVSDDLEYMYPGDDYAAALLILDVEALESRVEELRATMELAESDDIEYAETLALEHKHDDVRLEAVDKIDNQDVLEEVATTDKADKVKIAAIQKLENQDVLEEIALNKDNSDNVRKVAIPRIENDDVLKEISERRDDDPDDGGDQGDSFRVIYTAFEHIKDLEYVKEKALEGVDFKENVAAERITEDEDFLVKIFRKKITPDEDGKVYGQDTAKIILEKLDPVKYDKLFKEAALLPKQGHWDDNLQEFAMERIKDQKFLKTYVEEAQEDEGDENELFRYAIRGIDDQNWLKKRLTEDELETNVVEETLRRIKDEKFFIKFLEDQEKKTPFDEYSFTAFAVAISEVTTDQKTLQKIASHPKIWLVGSRRPAINKIDDEKFLLNLAAKPPGDNNKQSIVTMVTERLRKLGMSNDDIEKGIEKAKTSKKKKTKKKATR